MKINTYGTTRMKVEIDPVQVIETTIDELIGSRCWLEEEDGKYYKGWEAHRHLDDRSEISKELYDLVKSLKKSVKLLEEYNENIKSKKSG